MRQAERENINYISYYMNLINEYNNPDNCTKSNTDIHRRELVNKVKDAENHDIDSKLGAYYLINPNLEATNYADIFELDRVVLTRYRTGSHNLRIGTGRMMLPFEQGDAFMLM